MTFSVYFLSLGMNMIPLAVAEPDVIVIDDDFPVDWLTMMSLSGYINDDQL